MFDYIFIIYILSKNMSKINQKLKIKNGYFLLGTGQKSKGDTLVRCDNLARFEIIAQSDTLARRHFSTE